MFPEISHLTKYLTIPLAVRLALVLRLMPIREELGTKTSLTGLV